MHSGKAAIIAFVGLFLALQCCAFPCRAAQERIYIFMDEQAPPYTSGEEGGLCDSGLTKEIFDELFGRLGLRYQIRLVPWARALDNAMNGECDGIPLLRQNKERELSLRFTDTVVENSEQLYFLPERLGDFRWERFSDLKDLSLGLVRGYTYAQPLQDAIWEHGILVAYGKDTKMIFNMLVAGRVDAVVEDETLVRPLFAAHPEWADRITPAEKPVSTNSWHIGISRQSPLAEHIEAINRVLRDMRADGTLDRILDKR